MGGRGCKRSRVTGGWAGHTWIGGAYTGGWDFEHSEAPWVGRATPFPSLDFWCKDIRRQLSINQEEGPHQEPKS